MKEKEDKGGLREIKRSAYERLLKRSDERFAGISVKTDVANHRHIFIEAECTAGRGGYIYESYKGAENGRTV